MFCLPKTAWPPTSDWVHADRLEHRSWRGRRIGRPHGTMRDRIPDQLCVVGYGRRREHGRHELADRAGSCQHDVHRDTVQRHRLGKSFPQKSDRSHVVL